MNCADHRAPVIYGGMDQGVLRQQLDEVRALLRRAQALFGPDPVAAPREIAPQTAGRRLG
jgi:hypothetical protein